ncbi:MAG: hypothetical protein F6K19_19725 [Cyanothece sp. SIO1E1]|nr:hypothetical protein [Cyanothece sp. SIO1E1]
MEALIAAGHQTAMMFLALADIHRITGADALAQAAYQRVIKLASVSEAMADREMLVVAKAELANYLSQVKDGEAD